MKIEELDGLSLADIARKLLELYQESEQSVISEFSVNMEADMEELREMVKAIDERIDQLDDEI